MIWHHETAESVAKQLESSIEFGLSSDEAKERLVEYGHNHYREKKSTSAFKLWFRQLKSFPMVLLYIAALLLLCLDILFLYFYPGVKSAQILIEPLIMIFIPPIGHLIGAIWQKSGIAKLHTITNAQTTNVTVLRDGCTVEISAADVVNGDILFLEQGMIVPADCRLITSEDIFCDEFILTGDEADVAKNANDILDGITPMPDRTNMVYAGCGISHGHGTAIVVSTAQSTEYALMLNDPNRQDTLLPEMDKDVSSVERLVSLPILLLSVAVLIIGVLHHLHGFWDIASVISPVFMVIATTIPAGITATAIVATSIGMQHVVKDVADVRDLEVMDTLSRVTVICADKTGTLTTDKKEPICVFIGEHEELTANPTNRAQTLIRLATMCTASDTQKTGANHDLIANPTEAAIIEYARDIGIERRDLMEDTPRLAEIPFDTERKCFSVVHLVAGRRLMISMGAPETILSFCTSGPTENAEEACRDMANGALRVLAIAYKYADETVGEEIDASAECDMTFAGLIGLADHARTESVKAIAECSKGGIITMMMTGDNEVTAEAVGRELGILRDVNHMITGEQLAEMSHEEFDKSVDVYRVFARITPEQKERIIRAWQKRGAVVAATGNGLDDVPALQRADIGCVTAAFDCDMTRNESDITLYDKSFASLTEAIKQARGIYANIRKALQYAITCGLALIVATILTLLVSEDGTFILSSPAMAWNMFIGMLGVIAIAYESGDRHSLSEKPQRGLYRLMPISAWIETLWQGALTGICTFLAFDMGISGAGNDEEAVTFGLCTAFITLMVSRLLLLLTTHRHDPDKHFSNRMLPVMFTVCLVLSLAPLFIPYVNDFFYINAVYSVDWGFSNWTLAIILAAIPAMVTIVVRFVTNIIRQHAR